jgi:hypothetical protein
MPHGAGFENRREHNLRAYRRRRGGLARDRQGTGQAREQGTVGPARRRARDQDRHRPAAFGDHPDATLLALLELSDIVGEPWHEKVVAALQEIQPDADEAALAIINEVVAKHEAEEADFEGDEFEDEAEQEANAILEGPPPDLPPPVTPPEPLKLGTNTVWAETDPFSRAVTDLLELRTKPIARFVGVVSPTELREVADFLLAVAAAAEKAKAA